MHHLSGSEEHETVAQDTQAMTTNSNATHEHSGVRDLLDRIDDASDSKSEKGALFERLVKLYLEQDNIQDQEFDKVWRYTDWAKENDFDVTTDTGIDLVARMADGGKFAAIQCKHYREDRNIAKGDVDKFVSTALSKRVFERLILAVTTSGDLGRNVQDLMYGADEKYRVITIADLDSSNIDWSAIGRSKDINRKAKRLRNHQKVACEEVCSRLKNADRGKLVMACGTGKTFTALRITEQIAGQGKVLFMVPSLALMSQVVREWKNDSKAKFNAYSVCSDVTIGRERSPENEDDIDLTPHNLPFPATTSASEIATRVASPHIPNAMTVVFSTYHSIKVIEEAQQKHGLPEFDLIICDEAHRTAGATLKEDRSTQDEGHFTRIHDNSFVRGKKRIYMTATPKVYTNKAKGAADASNVELSSMDDDSKFGETLFHYGFSRAVDDKVLSDYRVIVLEMPEDIIRDKVQNKLEVPTELELDNITKIVGCYKALSKEGFDNKANDRMTRALAFCNSIRESKLIAKEFDRIVDEFSKSVGNVDALKVESRHVDGSYNSEARSRQLGWLKQNDDDNTCHILSNVRCLTEGVDVPELDAVLFLQPRRRQVDVIQAVGRVMRKYPGKDMGYVILPVVIPEGSDATTALDMNERYRVVWQVLNALRSHDERLNAKINAAALGEDVSDKIKIMSYREISAEDLKDMDSTVSYDTFTVKTKKPEPGVIIGGGDQPPEEPSIQQPDDPNQHQFTMYGAFIDDKRTRAIQAKIVERCGTKAYWSNLADSLGAITQTLRERIAIVVSDASSREGRAFQKFLSEIQGDLNPEITDSHAIDMLAQHTAIRPVFDSMFRDHRFTQSNPVSKSMDRVLKTLDKHRIEKATVELKSFYDNVTWCVESMRSSRGKQRLLNEIYENLFKKVFPTLSSQLGIVYTPNEIVDFIVRSVNDALEMHFGKTLGSKGVHILDPFTGTGTFIAHLLRSGIIEQNEIVHKYKNEIHANEIVPLAYYVAAINIEEAFHSQFQNREDYIPFDGIALADTFQMYEDKKSNSKELFGENTERKDAQRDLDIRVIIGNPPWSAGQKSTNDDAANVIYEKLESEIKRTYGSTGTKATVQRLYDSYIKAFRWASDRIIESGEKKGVVAFVSNGGWIDGRFGTGLRKRLAQEYSSLYVFNLRGDIHSHRRGAKGEGKNVFGSGTQTGVSIEVFILDPNAERMGEIHYCDINQFGKDMGTQEKLTAIQNCVSIGVMKKRDDWKIITPDDRGDWINLADRSLSSYPILGEKGKGKEPVFGDFSQGIATRRDEWAYNADPDVLKEKVTSMMDVYNENLDQGIDLSDVTRDPTKIAWTGGLKDKYTKGKRLSWSSEYVRTAMYGAFQKTNLYMDPMFIHSKYKMDKIFPDPDTKNIAIAATGIGSKAPFSTLMVDTIVDQHTLPSVRCYPRYRYLKYGDEMKRVDGISDTALIYFKETYPKEKIEKDDLFYYIYGLFHKPSYAKTFESNLLKELPRLPPVKSASDFWEFSKAGRELGELHVNYESAKPYPVDFAEGDPSKHSHASSDPCALYRVEQMKMPPPPQ